MPEVIITKEVRLLRHIFEVLSLFFPQTTYLKYVRVFFRNILCMDMDVGGLNDHCSRLAGEHERVLR